MARAMAGAERVFQIIDMPDEQSEQINGHLSKTPMPTLSLKMSILVMNEAKKYSKVSHDS